MQYNIIIIEGQFVNKWGTVVVSATKSQTISDDPRDMDRMQKEKIQNETQELLHITKSQISWNKSH